MNAVLENNRVNDIEFSADAPDYDPDTWNDLAIDSLLNVSNFFAELRRRNAGAAAMLQSASLFYLGALVSLFDNDDNPLNVNATRINQLLSSRDVFQVKTLMVRYFSHQQTRANCYAYMLDFKDGTPGCKPDPGGKTREYKSRLYRSYYDAMVAGAIDDKLIHAGSQMPPVRANFYRAALFIQESKIDPHFHWLREDFGASAWSHKCAHEAVTNLDCEGEPISNPKHAALGQMEFADYFYVPKGGVAPQFMYSGL